VVTANGLGSLVIGGGSGIGAALVARQRQAGTSTVVWDIAGELDVQCDVTDAAAIDAAVEDTRARWGVPDTVTVTAGVGHSALLGDATPEEFDRIMAINLRGPWLCLRAWANVWRADGKSGSMVALSSVSAHLADRSMGIYCTSKAALSMLVQVAAVEWGPDGIRVNAVAPGVTRTPMLGPPEFVDSSPWLEGVAQRTALRRLGDAQDIAETIAALHEMSWVTGQVIDCDGGLSLRSPMHPLG
jgi:NAD(P)-dependent dehydrogenase (short-subunit alcohol dehydrogenase family)